MRLCLIATTRQCCDTIPIGRLFYRAVFTRWLDNCGYLRSSKHSRMAVSKTFADEHLQQQFPGLERMRRANSSMDLEIISQDDTSTFAHKFLIETRFPPTTDIIQQDNESGKAQLKLLHFTQRYGIPFSSISEHFMADLLKRW